MIVINFCKVQKSLIKNSLKKATLLCRTPKKRIPSETFTIQLDNLICLFCCCWEFKAVNNFLSHSVAFSTEIFDSNSWLNK